MFILTVLEMVNSSSFKSKVGRKPLFELLNTLYQSSEIVPDTPVLIQFRECLFLTLESLAKNTKILLANQTFIMEELLPTILLKLQSKNSEVRFQALKVFTDLMT